MFPNVTNKCNEEQLRLERIPFFALAANFLQLMTILTNESHSKYLLFCQEIDRDRHDMIEKQIADIHLRKKVNAGWFDGSNFEEGTLNETRARAGASSLAWFLKFLS